MSRFAIRPARTPVHELARRADQLIASTRATLADGPRRQARHPARAGPPVGARGGVAELVIGTQAAHLGRRFGRDAFACARGLGLEVHRVPLASLQREGRRDALIDGRLCGGTILLADSLSGREACRVLAHELGHAILGPAATEADCDDFGRRFLGASLPETGAERWRRWQRELVEGQRAAARRSR